MLPWYLPDLLHLYYFSRHFLLGDLGPACLGTPYVLDGGTGQGPV